MLIETEPHQKLPFSGGLWVLALITIVLWGAVTARPFLIPVSIAALVAFLVTPLVRLLRRYKTPDFLAIMVATMLLILPFAFGGYILVRQAQSLHDDFPAIVSWLNHSLTTLSTHPLAERFGVAQYLSVTALTSRLTESAGQGIQLVIGGIRAVLDISSQVILVLLFAIMMLVSREHLRETGERILSRFESIEGGKLIDVVTDLIERFLIARLAIVLIVGIASVVVLWIFGLKYSFLIGAFVGMMTLIPAIGAVFGIVGTLIVALATGHGLLSVVLIGVALVAINAVEGNVLTPLLVGKHLNINALATFLGFFAGGLLWGIWGMFLSIPLLGIMRIVLSISPDLEPWGALLAEHEDKELTLSLLRQRFGKPADK